MTCVNENESEGKMRIVALYDMKENLLCGCVFYKMGGLLIQPSSDAQMNEHCYIMAVVTMNLL